MDYEKKYKQLHKFISDLYPFMSEYCKEKVEGFLPELKESEDERIKKTLINFFSKGAEYDSSTNGIKDRNIIAWLEKQGEQKPSIGMITPEESLGIDSETYNKIVDECIYGEQKHINKIEPKFKVGDWVVNTVGDTNQVVKVLDDGYTLDDNTFISNSWTTEHYHLWSIADAKEGDVIYLPNGNNEYYLFIFKGIENAAVMSFVHFYQYDDGTSEVEETIDWLSSVNDVFQPATKEHRDLLFKKMKDAGYEWDAEKKELKKIDARKNITLDGDLMDADCMIVEQKPADWSEEDEHRIKDTVYFLDTAKKHYASTVELDACINWLKSLKQRIGGKL